MARITPASGASAEVLEQLDDNVPYKARLKEIVELQRDEYQGRPTAQLILQWEVLDDDGNPGLEVRDYVKFNIGKQNTGSPQKLRQLCNAIAGKRGIEPIAWIEDDEPSPGLHAYSWSYDGANAHDYLREGIEVIFTGAAKEKQDKSGAYFAFSTYNAVPQPKARVRRAAPAPLPEPDESDGQRAYRQARENVDPDEVPF